MKSKVYFIGVNNADTLEAIKLKLARLLEVSSLLDLIRKNDKVVIKMHFGEEGNTGYVRPEYVRVVCESIAKKGARHFLCDTNTLYRGSRMNPKDHLRLAYKHGFTKEICSSEILIPNDTKKENKTDIIINQKFVKTAKIAQLFSQADVILGIAHFKGHLITGFGGALKNIGMGCATKEGKLFQHSGVSPLVKVEKCIACEQCLEACPLDAIFIKNDSVHIDPAKCIGCASCIDACPEGAIDVNWGAGVSNIQEKMVEYVKAVLKDKQNKSAFINFATKITKECDCFAKDDPRIVADVGILASRDPVSIDKASLDLVNKKAGKDIFREAHPSIDGFKQLKHADEVGLGNLKYELIELKL